MNRLTTFLGVTNTNCMTQTFDQLALFLAGRCSRNVNLLARKMLMAKRNVGLSMGNKFVE